MMSGSFRKHEGLGPGLFLAATVLICFIITFFVEGISPADLTIPSGENDELIYFYEVEGVIDHGIPQGFFGTTEITARVLSFGAWSPFLLLNFCILGKIFGWTALKAVIYNLVMFMTAALIFGLLARPDRRQTVMLAVFLSSYTLLMYEVLSVTPEITCYFFSIIFVSLCYSSFKENKTYKRVLMFVIAVLLTLMRPYYAGLFIPSAYFLYKKYGKKSLIASLLISLAAFYAYLFVSINLCAAPPIGGSFAKYVIKIGSSKGHPFLCGDFIIKLYQGLLVMYGELKRFFVDGIWGRNYFMFFLLFAIFIILWLKRRKGDTREKRLWRFFWIGYYAMMVVAVALYFNGWVADKHLAEFVVMGIFVLTKEAGDDRFGNILLVILEAGLIYSVMVVPNLPRHYLEPDKRQEIFEAKDELASLMPLAETGGPVWDNTVLWIYSDEVDGEKVELPWQSLFALPGGYGLNMVFKDDWLDQYSPVYSKYLAAVPGSDSEKRCVKWGGEKVLEYADIVIYRLY